MEVCIISNRQYRSITITIGMPQLGPNSKLSGGRPLVWGTDSPGCGTGVSSKSRNISSSWVSGKFPLGGIASQWLLTLIMPNTVRFCDVCIRGAPANPVVLYVLLMLGMCVHLVIERCREEHALRNANLAKQNIAQKKGVSISNKS